MFEANEFMEHFLVLVGKKEIKISKKILINLNRAANSGN